MPIRNLLSLCSALLLLAVSIPARAGVVEEKWPDGKPKLRYATDQDGKKNGEYLEYYETGKLKIQARYVADELSGTYTAFHPTGKPKITATYKQGKLNGEYTERDEDGQPVESATYREGEMQGTRNIFDHGKPVLLHGMLRGVLAYPKGVEEIRSELVRILGAEAGALRRPGAGANPPPQPAVNPDQAADNESGLNRLKAYRYLADLAYKDMALDDEMNKAAQAGAEICAKIGKLDHKPPNPGMPDAEYKLAYKGTSHSNLAQGPTRVSGYMDQWMDDSDDSNIDRVGHRRWCLNPTMLKTGFGRAGEFGAMWSFDEKRKDVPEYDFVCFPARGFMPANGFFRSHFAWTVSLNPKKYKVPDKAVKASVFGMDAKFNKDPKPLKNNYDRVNTDSFGIPNCIIFRPEKLDVSNGKRYWVEITGLKSKDGKEARVEYLVEFVDLTASPSDPSVPVALPIAK